MTPQFFWMATIVKGEELRALAARVLRNPPCHPLVQDTCLTMPMTCEMINQIYKITVRLRTYQKSSCGVRIFAREGLENSTLHYRRATGR